MALALEEGVLIAMALFSWDHWWISLAGVALVLVASWLLQRRTATPITVQRPFVQAPDKAARLHGPVLSLVAALMESSPLLRKVSKQTLAFGRLKDFQIDEVPTFIPRHFTEVCDAHPLSKEDLIKAVIDTQGSLDGRSKGFQYNTVADYHEAYTSGRCTPLEVGKRLISAVEHSNRNHSLRAIIDCNAEDVLAQAEASTARFKAGTQLGFLDGVPVSVKDQIDVRNYSTFKGIRATPRDTIADCDARAVEKLRAAGAVIFGKANQTEMGIHVTGLNSNERYGHCKNPYNPRFHTGGSSSGSGAAVAAGLGPISVAADGGGSIRLPAGICGQIGIKPTCGRVSLLGDTACFGSTVDVVGPIGATPADAAIALTVMSGRDVQDSTTLHSPSLRLGRYEQGNEGQLDFQGIRLGLDRAWFSRATDEVCDACNAAVAELTSRGATVVNITVPDLDLITEAHSLTISSEMFTDAHEHARYNPSFFKASTRLLFATASDTTAHEYLQAAKLRTRMMSHLLACFEKCDFIVTPNTALSTPALPEDLGLNGDESDVGKQLMIMRFMQVANFTGLPAVCMPVAYTADNMPIALQLIGKPWAEGDLLHAAAIMSTAVHRAKPEVYYNLLVDDS